MIRRRNAVAQLSAVPFAALLICGPGEALAVDTVIADAWTPVTGGDGVVWNDGFTGTYAGNPITPVDVNGNAWADFTVNSPYWGQYVQQSWAQPALTAAAFNQANVLEVVADFSGYSFFYLKAMLDLETSGGAGGTQTGSTGFVDLSRLLPSHQGAYWDGGAVSQTLVPGPSGPQRFLINLAALGQRDESATSATVNFWMRTDYVGFWDQQASVWRDTGAFGGPHHVLIDKMTLRSLTPGDANGDGTIGADDFALVDRGIALNLTAGALWSDGEFTGDGAVNSADYLVIDAAYLAQNGGSASAAWLADRADRFGAGYVSRLVAAVPEPASPGVVALGALGLQGWRRRR